VCSSDCMAEEERFEPSVRFWQTKPRHVRKLQIAKPYQRISHENRHQSLQLVRFRFAIHSNLKSESEAIPSKKVSLCEGPQGVYLWLAVTACLAGSQKSEKPIRRECSKKATK